MFAKTNQGIIETLAGIRIEVGLVKLGGVCFGGDKVFGVRDLLNHLLGVDFAALDYVLALPDFQIRTFKAELLPTLFQGVVWKDCLKERVQEVVEATIPFPIEELPLEDVMPTRNSQHLKTKLIRNGKELTDASISILVSHASKMLRIVRNTPDHIHTTSCGIQYVRRYSMKDSGAID
jgi:hypothetical protein